MPWPGGMFSNPLCLNWPEASAGSAARVTISVSPSGSSTR